MAGATRHTLTHWANDALAKQISLGMCWKATILMSNFCVISRVSIDGKFPVETATRCIRVAQNAQGVVKGVIMGVTRASFGRRAPLTPQLKRASARRREEKDYRGVYKIQRWRLCTLVGDRHPVLKQKMTYECTVWVPLESYWEY